MSLFKCKMCGGALEVDAGATVMECEYCGMQQTLPKLDDERRASMYDRANHFRRNNEFDKAMGIYENILNEDGTDAEAYWSLILCRYGIEYVEDPVSHKRIPTVNRAQFTSIYDDDNYKSALQYADSYQKHIYEEEARTINEIQKGILAISQKEEPFDVFICYKESDNTGRRTPDSVLAQELYYGLKDEGFQVFFARITLEDKLGSAYEPYIFAALNSAKVMVTLGTKPEYFNAVWVKNEWSRYLALIKQGQKKMLIPAYKNMDPYDLPEEFSHLQAQDMSKLGFMQDLIRGIKKIVAKDEPKPATVVKETVVKEASSATANVAPLLRRAFMFLEDGDWKSADEYCEKVLDINPENAEAYLGKLMAELRVTKRNELKEYSQTFDGQNNYQKALRFGDAAMKKELQDTTQYIKERNEQKKFLGLYNDAVSAMNAAKTEEAYKKAAEQFAKFPQYKDSEELRKKCLEKAETCRMEVIYKEAVNVIVSVENLQYEDLESLKAEKVTDVDIKKAINRLQSIANYKDSKEKIAELEKGLEKWYAVKKAAEEAARKKQYDMAISYLSDGRYDDAIKRFVDLGDYLDSKEQIQQCNVAKETARKENLYIEAIAVLSAENVTEYALKSSIETLESISDYKDAKEKSKEVAACLERFYVAEMEYKAALKARRKKIAIRISVVLIILALIAAGIVFVTRPQSITYDLNGGIAIGENPTSYMMVSGTITLANPVRDGYTFTGWTGTKLTNPTTAVAIKTFSFGDRAYTANWQANNYTISFDAGGGNVGTPSQVVTYDANVELPVPVREGYTFSGWYVEDKPYSNGSWKNASDLTLVAKWTANQYTLTLRNVYGSATSCEYSSNANVEMQVTFDASYRLPVPKRSGYSFLGWYSQNQKYDQGTWAIADNVTLTPKWEANKYTIKLNANGGSVSSSSIAVTYDQSFNLPIPTRTGYTFAGWYNGTSKYSSSVWRWESSIELSAKWSPNNYSVTYKDTATGKEDASVLFDYNYSNAPTVMVTLREGQVLNYPDIPTRNGYVFAGWYSSSTGGSKYTFSGKITGRKTLYAKWIAHDSTSVATTVGTTVPVNLSGTNYTYFAFVPLVSERITIYSSGGRDTVGYLCNSSYSTLANNDDGGTGSNFSISYNVTAGTLYYIAVKAYSTPATGDVTISISGTKKPNSTLQAGAPIESGYAYSPNETIGQNISYDTYFTLITPKRKGYTFLGWYDGDTEFKAGTWQRLQNITLTAKWQANDYTVTLDANGGTVSVTNIDVTAGEAFTLPDAEKAGYTFAGWYYGQEKVESGIWTEDQNLTLVAKWSAESYSVQYNSMSVSDVNAIVTFNLNYSGSTAIEFPLVNGEKLTYPDSPKRSGYVFAGWYTDSSCTTKYNFSGTITGNMTLYAKWLKSSVANVAFVDSNTKVMLTGTSYEYFAFVPLVSETITIYSSGDCDTYGVLYSSSMSQITYNDDSGSSSNFSISYNVSAGTIYYIGVRVYEGVALGNISLHITGTPHPNTSATVNSSTTTKRYVLNARSSVSEMVEYGSEYTLPIPIREGYTFVGWYNGNQKVESGTWNFASNITLASRWSACENTITLNANGGSVSRNTVTVTYNERYSLPTPTRTDYTFIGWYDGETRYTGSYWDGLNDITLVAKWVKSKYTITYDDIYEEKTTGVKVTLNYNYSGSYNRTISITNGNKLSYPEIPTRSGYVFTGWYTNSSCTTLFSFSGTITQDMTLYAGWKSYYASGVVYVDSYYSIVASSSSQKYYAMVPLVSERIDLVLSGSKGMVVSLYDSTMKELAHFSSGSSTTTNYSYYVTAGMLYYIGISKDSSYSSGSSYVYLDIYGTETPTSTAVANVSTSSQYVYNINSYIVAEVKYGESYTHPVPVRTGYTFLGWYLGDTKIESGIWHLMSNVTLTPKWQ